MDWVPAFAGTTAYKSNCNATHYINCRGNQRLIAGTYVTNAKLNNNGTSHGRIAIVVRSTESFATLAKTNNTNPIGGCNRPIMRFNTITRPKCTGSIPS